MSRVQTNTNALTQIKSVEKRVSRVERVITVQSVPGDLIPSAASSRDGCLLCDGSSYLRSNYANLFAAIGTAYGSADGAHFNVPDLRGRLPLGAGTGTGSGATGWTLGEQPTSGAGGEQSHVQSSGELASHTHGLQMDVSHGSDTSSIYIPGGSGPNSNYGISGYAGTVNTQGAGSSSAMNILPPVSVVNWFIVHG